MTETLFSQARPAAHRSTPWATRPAASTAQAKCVVQITRRLTPIARHSASREAKSAFGSSVPMGRHPSRPTTGQSVFEAPGQALNRRPARLRGAGFSEVMLP